MTASLLLLMACAPKPSVIRGERLVTDFTQEYNGAAGAGAGWVRPWLGSAQDWRGGPQASLAAERAFPGHLAWWSGAAWSSHGLQGGDRTFDGSGTTPITASAVDGHQVLIWAETGIQYTPDRGWTPGPVDLRLLMRGTLALGGIQTRLDVPSAGGRTRLETTDLLLAPNGHVGVQGVWDERWDLRLLVGASPLVAFDRAELGGGDSGRITLRTHATVETLVRF